MDDPRFQPPRAAYLHVPFCRHRCGYCNFTLLAGRDDLIEAYLAAVEVELSWLARPRPVDTLFLGGGTPTHLSPAQLARLLETIGSWLPLADGGEFTVEANPADVTAERMDLLQRCGVTRLSLGAQSFDEQKLKVLERDHRRAEIERAFELARAAVDSVSLDLIFGAPGESLQDWRADLAAALSLAPDHISTYGLTFERGTRFWSRLQAGELARAAESLEGDMYELAIDALTASGLTQYEVSNFARVNIARIPPVDHRCRHNEVYWTGRPYLAAGPGAARFVAGRREVNHRSTTTYLKRVLSGRSPVAESEQLGAEDAARERLVFGLRRLAGVSRTAFERETGYSICQLCGPTIAHLVDQRLMINDGDILRLSRQGLLVSDAIWPSLL